MPYKILINLGCYTDIQIQRATDAVKMTWHGKVTTRRDEANKVYADFAPSERDGAGFRRPELENEEGVAIARSTRAEGVRQEDACRLAGRSRRAGDFFRLDVHGVSRAPDNKVRDARTRV